MTALLDEDDTFIDIPGMYPYFGNLEAVDHHQNNKDTHFNIEHLLYISLV